MKKPNDQLEKEQKAGEDIPLKRAQVASERVRSGAPSPAAGNPHCARARTAPTNRTRDNINTSEDEKKLGRSNIPGGSVNLPVSQKSRFRLPSWACTPKGQLPCTRRSVRECSQQLHS